MEPVPGGIDEALRGRLHGRHQGKHAVRLTYEYRIVLILRMTAREVLLLDVGSHDEVYQN